jgi:hypothetical protein
MAGYAKDLRRKELATSLAGDHSCMTRITQTARQDYRSHTGQAIILGAHPGRTR